jgi:hypothetical protein
MPLSLNEIRDRATAFAREYRDASSENAEAQSFWGDFFKVFGINARRVGAFEKPAQNLASQSGRGRIDYLWKGVVLVEHKSRGQDLDRAAGQARDYFPSLKDSELPRYIIVSDFARIRLYDLEADQTTEFPLAELPRRLGLFGFISGYTTRNYGSLNAVDVEAAEKLGLLHDLLEDDGFGGKALDVWMVRTLFCLFADNAGIFETGIFRALIETRSAEDGSDLGALITRLHRVLATPEQQRQKSLDESLAAFPYVNGRLFDAPVEQPETNTKMRAALLDCARVDWSRVSPAIFGSLFQSIKNRAERRRGGEHYTTEANILKCLDPLFLDGLRAELAAAKQDARRLNAFLLRLRRIRIFDPACGCGNFLVVAYRELRRLELEALRRRYGGDDAGQLVGVVLSQVNVDQMFGIEVEDWPAQIAQVALWLTDHQLNMELSQEFGLLRIRLPLTTAPQILVGNALREDWAGFVKPGADVYCVGNPPFIGKHYRSPTQSADMRQAMDGFGNIGDVDYVAAWFWKAAAWMQETSSNTAFVATSSLTQGEQAAILWPALFGRFRIKLHFGYRTFPWHNDARGVAAVHCVIIGFGAHDTDHKCLFDRDTASGTDLVRRVGNLSPYLIEGPDVVVTKTRVPLGQVPEMRCGSKPSDGGNLILTDLEKEALLRKEPGVAPWLRKYVGGEEFINGGSRWCLWLKGIEPQTLRALPATLDRVEKVRAFRLASTAVPTRKAANSPSLFFFDSQPPTDYIAIPEVSSERRQYVLIGILDKSIIASNTCYLIPSRDVYLLGVLCSLMHMVWTRLVAGRLESRIRYSASVVYNTFPWPTPTEAQRATIERAAQGILDARAAHPGASLADLYDPLTMPPNLVAAHAANDRAVDAAYGQPRGFPTEAARLAFLFDLYQNLVAPLDATPTRRRPKSRRGPG